MNRRKFSKIAAAAIGAGAVTGLYAWRVEPFWLEFVNVSMPVKNLPSSMEGKTLMQISDMHVGNRFDHRFIRDAFVEAKKLKPDFVVYTGDFVNWESKQQLDQLSDVFEEVVLGKMATLGVLGNHDYGKNWAEENVANDVIDVLDDKGVRILRNELFVVDGLNFVGIDDYWATNFKPTNVLDKHNSKRANITLCHNPDVADLDIWKDYDSWILSGHTHGGQCKPPFLPPPVLPVKNKDYTAGIFDLSSNRKLYINRALGHSFQVRFNVRPEITVFTLQNA